MIYTYNWLTDIDPYSTPTDELPMGTYWEYAANHFNGVMGTDKWYKLTINDSGTNRSCLAYRSAHGNYDFAVWICNSSSGDSGTYPSTLYADTATIATVNLDYHYHYIGWINRNTGVPSLRDNWYCYRHGRGSNVDRTEFNSYSLNDYPMIAIEIDKYSNMTSFGVIWVYKDDTSLWNPTIISPQGCIVDGTDTTDYIHFNLYSSSQFILCSEINGTVKKLTNLLSGYQMWQNTINDSLILLPIYNGEYFIDGMRYYSNEWTILDELMKITEDSPTGKAWVENAIVVDNVTYAIKGVVAGNGNTAHILVKQS